MPTVEPKLSAPSPAEFLRGVFLQRREKNPAYSTRAFARDLGISQALLSLVMNGKRPLTIKQATQISALLGLSSDDAQSFLDSAIQSLPENSKGIKKLKSLRLTPQNFKNFDVERFKAISQWYHVALLDLATTKDFQANVSWIAARLGISTLEARDALERLLDLGFLVKADGKVKKSEGQIYFVTQKSEAAVRNFHKQMLAKAQAALDKTKPEDFAKREISGFTIAARSDRIAEAKLRIQKFQKELATFLTEGECDEVFQLNVQLFSLTERQR